MEFPRSSSKKLELEAIKFFSSPVSIKEKAGPVNSESETTMWVGYENKSIDRNNDVGWVEYLLLNAKPKSDYQRFLTVFEGNPGIFRGVVRRY